MSSAAIPPLPQGYKLDNGLPPLPKGYTLDGTSSAAPQGDDERFARSFNKGITGAEDPGQLWQNLKNEASQIVSNPTQEADPSKILQGIHQGMTALWNRASEEAKQGNLTTAKGLLNYLNAGVHFVESGVPVVGTMLGQADQQMSQGDVAGGAGTATAALAPAIMGGVGGGIAANTGEVTNPAPSAVKGATSAVRKVVREQAPAVVGGAAGAAIGHATGIPGMGEIGGIAGYAAGKRLFPVADEVAAQDVAKVEPTPTNPEPVPAAQYLNAKKAGATDAEARTQSAAIYKDAQEARQGVGKAIDDVLPPSGDTQAANLKTKAEVDFYLQRGNVPAAVAAVQKSVPRGTFPKDFTPSDTNFVKGANPSEPQTPAAYRADALDDKAVAEEIQHRIGVSDSAMWQELNAQRRMKESPAVNKGDLVKNATVKSYPEAAQDLTSILEESVRQAKAQKAEGGKSAPALSFKSGDAVTFQKGNQQLNGVVESVSPNGQLRIWDAANQMRHIGSAEKLGVENAR